MNARPNIVLVHGAWADGSSWSGVVERLQADGYHVTAPQFPLTSLAADVARLRQVLDLQDGPAIVAGHSYGGQVMTALGPDAPNVAGLVYIAAFGLDQGESLGALLSQGPVTPALAHLFTDTQGFCWLSEDDFVSHFAGDVDPVKAKVMYAVQQALATSAFGDFLHSISGPIVLVGHSYGGAVITNAATGDPQVKALVYVDAFAPARGQTLAQLLASYPGSCAVPANLQVVAYPGAPSGAGDAYIKQSVFPSCMANGLPATEAHVLAVTQRPIATIALTQKSGVPAWKTIPSWAVVGTADHAIPLALQLAMANRAHAHITRVDAPHLSMISDPGTVTNVILQAVRATS